jgi:transglutaminase-like putative cysteine protease
MLRTVSCTFGAEISEAEASAQLIVAVAAAHGTEVDWESLVVSVDGTALPTTEVVDEHGGRLHLVRDFGNGHLEVDYGARCIGRAQPPPVEPVDLVRYLRPSRYCEADRLAAFARAEFHGIRGLSLLDAVSSWVGMRVAYVAGSSRSIDGAVATLLARQGVCRDFAHLVVALLRACEVPARLAAVYAPGLQPMDFHAVAEAYVDGRWLAVDATRLAPRVAMLRIATGRDAADTAFLTSLGCSVELTTLEVTATTDGDLAVDDLSVPAYLG